MLTSKAKTPEELRKQIVEYLKHQASIYRSASTLAERKKVKSEAIAKSDCLMFMAKSIEEMRIEK